ncbi:replicative helicase loader/inhibitor [Bacillus sp. V5-8f]|uniref:replicative helicase loader/inhibitor n=1 Tax=Bacillus sp. V5-8f TaxID=2053044 RepID=UPI000C792592|nr:replicative helicase loader/inhibitor [Bacillus sp. V5-8f]PLT33505.1 hypothetical protein CUU64_13090 [Bacillus sp. V5-8f]
MTKRELFTLLDLITEYYDQFEVDQKKVDSWHEALRAYSFEKVKENTLAFVTTSPYPPKISDLVGGNPVASRYVPDDKETVVVLYTREKPASEEVIQEELAKMRQILGIRRG